MKGSNLCHGTGGNGYAFLKLHRRTGDPVWLERARAFAMTAIAQCRETARDEDHKEREHERAITRLERAAGEVVQRECDAKSDSAHECDRPHLPSGQHVQFDVPFVDTAGTIDKSKVITLDPMYRSSLVYYIVGRAQLRDDEPTTDQRAGAMLQKFIGQMLTIQS